MYLVSPVFAMARALLFPLQRAFVWLYPNTILTQDAQVQYHDDCTAAGLALASVDMFPIIQLHVMRYYMTK